MSGLLKRARGPDSLDHALIIAAYEAPARTMAAGEDEDFPAAAGMTFLGPFIGHDATLDVASALGARIDPTESRNVRAPTLDLGRACGDRPEAPLHPYGALDARRGAERMPVLGAAASPPLLARTSGGHALIGDPRNDGNQIVSHAQGRIIRLHAILMPKATQDETHVGDRAKTGAIRRSGSIARQAG